MSFKLTAPDPDFNYKLSLRFVCPQKPGGPQTRSNLPEPTTGPYMITQSDDKTVVDVRNPNWDANAKIMGLDAWKGKLWNVDGLEVEIGVAPDQQLLKLKNEEADMSWTGDTPCLPRRDDRDRGRSGAEGPIPRRSSTPSSATLDSSSRSPRSTT